MIYPVGTLIKYLFGSRDAANKLLSNITPKGIIRFHIINLILSSFIIYGLSGIMADLIIEGEMYEIVSQFVEVSATTVFQSFLPMMISSYLLLIIILIIMAISYYLIARLFKSEINLRSMIYASQFMSVLHPIFHISLLLLILASNLNLIVLTIIPIYIVGIILFFTISKQYAQISGITTFTIVLFNLILLGIIIATLALIASRGIPTI